MLEQESWFLVEGASLASTHILKPEPVSARLAGLTLNEFPCMRLARRIGLPVAAVDLVRVPARTQTPLYKAADSQKQKKGSN